MDQRETCRREKGRWSGYDLAINMIRHRCVIMYLGKVMLLLCFAALLLLSTQALEPTDPRSPLYQHLPDCLNDPHHHRVPPKRTTWKGILCPMIKDEVGFLSEWIAYYEVHGFDKIILFDNNSTTSMAEIDPWRRSGFVEVVQDGWATEQWLFKNPKHKFFDMMHVKYKSEVLCKERAVAMGYDVFLSVDTDEYVIPNNPNITLMDDLQEWFSYTTRGVGMMHKYQYNAAPHFMEPVNLLTIEAYTLRTKGAGQMSYYTNVGTFLYLFLFLSLYSLSFFLVSAGKVALQLSPRNNAEYTNDTVQYLIHCCDFHGCSNMRANKHVCMPLYDKGGEILARS